MSSLLGKIHLHFPHLTIPLLYSSSLIILYIIVLYIIPFPISIDIYNISKMRIHETCIKPKNWVAEIQGKSYEMVWAAMHDAASASASRAREHRLGKFTGCEEEDAIKNNSSPNGSSAVYYVAPSEEIEIARERERDASLTITAANLTYSRLLEVPASIIMFQRYF